MLTCIEQTQMVEPAQDFRQRGNAVLCKRFWLVFWTCLSSLGNLCSSTPSSYFQFTVWGWKIV